jgi:hypothetical protein
MNPIDTLFDSFDSIDTPFYSFDLFGETQSFALPPEVPSCFKLF